MGQQTVTIYVTDNTGATYVEVWDLQAGTLEDTQPIVDGTATFSGLPKLDSSSYYLNDSLFHVQNVPNNDTYTGCPAGTYYVTITKDN
jgi:hypothetical protein